MASVTPAVRLDVWADVACPWCFIGVRHLRDALEQVRGDGVAVDVRHRPFRLEPALPADGVDFGPHMHAKLGGEHAAAGAFERVTEVGRSVGIDFDFDAVGKMPATVLAHRAVLAYDGDPRQEAVLDALFSAYFERGLDITNPTVVVVETAAAAGESLDAVRERLAEPRLSVRVEDDGAVAAGIGVHAVPTFVADAGEPDGPLGLSDIAVAVQGAQPACVLVGLLHEAVARA